MRVLVIVGAFFIVLLVAFARHFSKYDVGSIGTGLPSSHHSQKNISLGLEPNSENTHDQTTWQRSVFTSHTQSQQEFIDQLAALLEATGLSSETQSLLMKMTLSGQDFVDELEILIRRGLNEEVRDAAARCLALIGTQKATGVLMSAIIEEDDEQMKDLLSRSLQLLSNPEAAPVLVNSLLRSSNDYHAISAILEAAPRVLDASSMPLILENYRLSELDEWQKISMLGLLSSVERSEVVIALADILRVEEDIDLIEASARALSRIGSPEAVDVLIAVLEEEIIQDLKGELLWSVENIQNKGSAVRLLEVFESTTNHVIKHAVARALARIGKDNGHYEIEDLTNLEK